MSDEKTAPNTEEKLVEVNDKSLVDIQAKIDALASRESSDVNIKQDGEKPAEIRNEPASDTKPIVPHFRYNFPEPIYKGHKPLIDKSVDPHEIPHIVRGRQRGCQCFNCKKERGEVFEIENVSSTSEGSPEAIDTILSDLLDEEIIADILNAPRQTAIFLAELKKAPLSVQKALEIDAKRLKMYGKWGKHLADHYLRLPFFKHKELIVFGVWWGFDNALSMSKAMLALKISKMEEKK